MVAAFPDQIPEVHVASLHPSKGLLLLREANVASAGDVALGDEKRVDLKRAGSVISSDGVVAVLGRDRKLMVQMHLETEEEQSTWTQALQMVIDQFLEGRGGGVSGRSPKQTSVPPSPAARSAQAKSPANQATRSAKQVQEPENQEAELPMLRARSQQLQTRIGSLEAMSTRRDKQAQKLLKRLDGAMQMLDAVQDMCSQQRKVIEVQQVAISELRKECGQDEDEDEDEEEDEEPEQYHAQMNGADHKKTEDEEPEQYHAQMNGADHKKTAEMEAEMEQKAEQMLALLKQADEMQRALQELQAMEAAGISAGSLAPREQDSQEMDDEVQADSGDTETEAVLNRLQGLEEEKSRFEGMLAESQNEHQDLLQQLESMRSLMTAMGMNTDDLDDEEP